MSGSLPSLTFGVELEFALAYINKLEVNPDPTERRKIQWGTQRYVPDPITAIMAEIRETLRRAGLQISNLTTEPIGIRLWILKEDVSVQSPRVGANGDFADDDPLVPLIEKYNWAGLELVSPPFLATQEALNQIQEICDFLKSRYCINNNMSTDMHVHMSHNIPGESFSFEFTRKLMAFFWCFEPQLNTIHPTNRQEGIYYLSMREGSRFANRYRRKYGSRISPLAGICRILECKDFEELHEQVREYTGRTRGINAMHRASSYSIFRFQDNKGRCKPTIEFRQHCGTFDGTEIINWIQTLLAMVDFVRKADSDSFTELLAMAKNETWEKLGDGNDAAREQSMGPILADEGFTIVDLLEHIGAPGPAAHYARKWAPRTKTVFYDNEDEDERPMHRHEALIPKVFWDYETTMAPGTPEYNLAHALRNYWEILRRQKSTESWVFPHDHPYWPDHTYRYDWDKDTDASTDDGAGSGRGSSQDADEGNGGGDDYDDDYDDSSSDGDDPDLGAPSGGVGMQSQVSDSLGDFGHYNLAAGPGEPFFTGTLRVCGGWADLSAHPLANLPPLIDRPSTIPEVTEPFKRFSLISSSSDGSFGHSLAAGSSDLGSTDLSARSITNQPLLVDRPSTIPQVTEPFGRFSIMSSSSKKVSDHNSDAGSVSSSELLHPWGFRSRDFHSSRLNSPVRSDAGSRTALPDIGLSRRPTSRSRVDSYEPMIPFGPLRLNRSAASHQGSRLTFPFCHTAPLNLSRDRPRQQNSGWNSSPEAGAGPITEEIGNTAPIVELSEAATIEVPAVSAEVEPEVVADSPGISRDPENSVGSPADTILSTLRASPLRVVNTTTVEEELAAAMAESLADSPAAAAAAAAPRTAPRHFRSAMTHEEFKAAVCDQSLEEHLKSNEEVISEMTDDEYIAYCEAYHPGTFIADPFPSSEMRRASAPVLTPQVSPRGSHYDAIATVWPEAEPGTIAEGLPVLLSRSVDFEWNEVIRGRSDSMMRRDNGETEVILQRRIDENGGDRKDSPISDGVPRSSSQPPIDVGRWSPEAETVMVEHSIATPEAQTPTVADVSILRSPSTEEAEADTTGPSTVLESPADTTSRDATSPSPLQAELEEELLWYEVEGTITAEETIAIEARNLNNRARPSFIAQSAERENPGILEWYTHRFPTEWEGYHKNRIHTTSMTDERFRTALLWKIIEESPDQNFQDRVNNLTANEFRSFAERFEPEFVGRFVANPFETLGGRYGVPSRPVSPGSLANADNSHGIGSLEGGGRPWEGTRDLPNDE